jgi:hypothetical protein
MRRPGERLLCVESRLPTLTSGLRLRGRSGAVAMSRPGVEGWIKVAVIPSLRQGPGVRVAVHRFSVRRKGRVEISCVGEGP